MDRRNSIKKIALTTSTMVVLPSWAEAWSTESVKPTTTNFTGNEEELLTSLADTIIPAGDSIGALSVGVDQFLLRLFSDCYEKDVQNSIRSVLEEITKIAQNSNGKAFSKCDQSVRLKVLDQYSTSADEDKIKIFTLIKAETIRGFRTSKVVMTEYLDYKIIPGHYHGCVEINT